jgi:RNA polymerase sigma-70 factor (ECF subfamily)
MTGESWFDELLRRVVAGDEQAAAQLVQQYEPLIRRDIRFRLRDRRVRRLFDSMDICQSVLASFFVRVAAGQFELREPGDLIKLLLTMTRNKLAKQLQRQRRQRRDDRRTVGEVETLGLAEQDASPSRIAIGKELLQEVHRRLNDEERRLADMRTQGLGWEEVAASEGGTAEARRKQFARAVDRVVGEMGLDEV